jgi:hypothetical protein
MPQQTAPRPTVFSMASASGSEKKKRPNCLTSSCNSIHPGSQKRRGRCSRVEKGLLRSTHSMAPSRATKPFCFRVSPLPTPTQTHFSC